MNWDPIPGFSFKMYSAIDPQPSAYPNPRKLVMYWKSWERTFIEVALGWVRVSLWFPGALRAGGLSGAGMGQAPLCSAYRYPEECTLGTQHGLWS